MEDYLKFTWLTRMLDALEMHWNINERTYPKDEDKKDIKYQQNKRRIQHDRELLVKAIKPLQEKIKKNFETIDDKFEVI